MTDILAFQPSQRRPLAQMYCTNYSHWLNVPTRNLGDIDVEACGGYPFPQRLLKQLAAVEILLNRGDEVGGLSTGLIRFWYPDVTPDLLMKHWYSDVLPQFLCGYTEGWADGGCILPRAGEHWHTREEFGRVQGQINWHYDLAERCGAFRGVPQGDMAFSMGYAKGLDDFAERCAGYVHERDREID